MTSFTVGLFSKITELRGFPEIDVLKWVPFGLKFWLMRKGGNSGFINAAAVQNEGMWQD